MKHGLGWQDDQAAQLVSCDGHSVEREGIIVSVDNPVECPRCHRTLLLEWNVQVKEVAP